ncbi:SIR2-like protein [Rhodobacter aestuarii]|uniref:SIR2-like domain-containing protein n=1 Tax=Rhodobacter aestuarii TaxID=453582 RepID=A0A1N7NTK4_9RHOB|nr:SIR2 family protein [Rhodobacter aestuarii]PTV94560.1 SIR2-like protein [Rhodobacter aestuarii]SIT01647.1 SIR2-like domain-containing protein [Rhodobacter aestuarii]
MADLDLLDTAMAEVAQGKRVPYLGAEVSALSGSEAPSTPPALSAILESKVRVPRRAVGNLWAVAQYIESRKFRGTLNKLVRDAFAVPPGGANPVYDWLARVRPPMVVDSWYDDAILRAFGPGRDDWGYVQGVSRSGGWTEDYYRAFTAGGGELDAADPNWPSLIYKPHGLATAEGSFLMSDADYVEVLTEIDIQTPIPEEVQNRRTGRPFLFLGCRFDDQLLRIYARQIAKRSGTGHIAVIPGPLTKMEEKFFEELSITRIDAPLSEVTERLTVAEG